MKRLLTALFCLAGIASAQTYQPPPDAKWVQKVIDVKYANTNALAQLLGGMKQGRNADSVTAQLDLHAISVGSYDPSFLKLAEDIIKRYDVPTAAPAAPSHHYGVEIVAYILLAGPKGSSGDALPTDLEPVAKQLRSVFGYTDIRLLESSLIRGREATSLSPQVEVSGTLSGLAEGQKVPVIYQIRVRKIGVESNGKLNTVALEHFSFEARLPYEAGPDKTDFMGLGFNTDLSIAEGQKVVVGKSHIGAGNQALILVLSARIVE
jgi:hypothetical protein